MIVIMISDDGKDFQVRTPEGNDITHKYQANAMVIETPDGKFLGGFHIGQDMTAKVVAGIATAFDNGDPLGQRGLGDGT